MVIPRSRSRSLESITRSTSSSLAREDPGLTEHVVDEGGLAVVDVGDDGDVAGSCLWASSGRRALTRFLRRVTPHARRRAIGVPVAAPPAPVRRLPPRAARARPPRVGVIARRNCARRQRSPPPRAPPRTPPPPTRPHSSTRATAPAASTALVSRSAPRAAAHAPHAPATVTAAPHSAARAASDRAPAPRAGHATRKRVCARCTSASAKAAAVTVGTGGPRGSQERRPGTSLPATTGSAEDAAATA